MGIVTRIEVIFTARETPLTTQRDLSDPYLVLLSPTCSCVAFFPQVDLTNSSTNSSSGTSSPKGTPSTKKKSPSNGYDPKAPLVSWHVRNSCSPKSCNGWNWEGEGKIQKVYLNVSRHANKFNVISQSFFYKNRYIYMHI